jgi:hypothetical protein
MRELAKWIVPNGVGRTALLNAAASYHAGGGGSLHHTTSATPTSPSEGVATRPDVIQGTVPIPGAPSSSPAAHPACATGSQDAGTAAPIEAGRRPTRGSFTLFILLSLRWLLPPEVAGVGSFTLNFSSRRPTSLDAASHGKEADRGIPTFAEPFAPRPPSTLATSSAECRGRTPVAPSPSHGTR